MINIISQIFEYKILRRKVNFKQVIKKITYQNYFTIFGIQTIEKKSPF